MVVVKTKLYATLRRYTPEIPLGNATEIGLPEGAKIADLVDRLGISPDEVKLVFVNGVQREAAYVVQEGDDIALFPPIAGGGQAGKDQDPGAGLPVTISLLV